MSALHDVLGFISFSSKYDSGERERERERSCKGHEQISATNDICESGASFAKHLRKISYLSKSLYCFKINRKQNKVIFYSR